ncbi:MAG TPA: helix-turn-helix domain-containing protein [Jiangellales bacterium]|nr:helix-turn-helix domain-containing protein [Jiangellales bacterium]
MHRVAAVAGQGVLTFDLAVPCEVFGLDRSDIVSPWYDFITVAVDEPPLRASTGGFVLDTPYRLPDLESADTVVVPGWSDPDLLPSDDLCGALRSAYDRGARMMSICIGAFVLAAAGLLDGRRATTHWMYAARLAARYPAVRVEPEPLYIDDGQVLTSAGTAAGLDLCLHVVRLDHGARVANAVARRIVIPPYREGGQAQYIDEPLALSSEGRALARTEEWALEHLDRPLTLGQLASQASMSERTFTRRFRAATGTSPQEWLLAQRIRLAQLMLETTDETVERIATRCGFGTAATLRHHFAHRVGTSPLAYRRTFRGTAERAPSAGRAAGNAAGDAADDIVRTGSR